MGKKTKKEENSIQSYGFSDQAQVLQHRDVVVNLLKIFHAASQDWPAVVYEE